MPDVMSRADSLREYLTGATADGGVQADPALSVGNYRSTTELTCYGITLQDAINNLVIDFASGGCAEGDGILTCLSGNSLNWQDADGTVPGPTLVLPSNGSTGIVEGTNTGSYLRVTRGSGILSGGPCTVSLASLINNVVGMDDLTSAQAAAGISSYHGTMLMNQGTLSVGNIQRYIALLGTTQPSNIGQLSGSGAGTIQTNGSFADWPTSGWCQVRAASTLLLKEIVYYSSRSATVLNVPVAGRGRLATVATAGSATDSVYPVPGIAIALDVTGIQNNGQPMVNTGNQNTAPPGVIWNKGVTPATGIQVGTLESGKEIGLWIWREIPIGAVASPGMLNKIVTIFQAA